MTPYTLLWGSRDHSEKLAGGLCITAILSPWLLDLSCVLHATSHTQNDTICQATENLTRAVRGSKSSPWM